MLKKLILLLLTIVMCMSMHTSEVEHDLYEDLLEHDSKKGKKHSEAKACKRNHGKMCPKKLGGNKCCLKGKKGKYCNSGFLKGCKGKALKIKKDMLYWF